MGVYDSQIALAKKLIAAKGGPAIWRQEEVTSDPSTPWDKSNSAMTEYPVRIAFLPATSLLSKLFAGSNVSKGGMRGLMATVVDVAGTRTDQANATSSVIGFTPTEADVVIRGTETLSLESVDSLNVNDEIILWKLEFKA